MKWLVEKSRYLALFSVFGLLAGAFLSLFWGLFKTFETFKLTFTHYADGDYKLISLFDCLDSFLVSAALLVLGISLYELFIGELDVPDWMLVKDLNELKAKFTFVIVPVLAVKFVEKLLQSENALETLYYGIAVALVSASLSAFNLVSQKEKKIEKEINPNNEREEKRAADV